jgi:hypothetical protein
MRPPIGSIAGVLPPNGGPVGKSPIPGAREMLRQGETGNDRA